jgi:hypothetical protein
MGEMDCKASVFIRAGGATLLVCLGLGLGLAASVEAQLVRGSRCTPKRFPLSLAPSHVHLLGGASSPPARCPSKS